MLRVIRQQTTPIFREMPYFEKVSQSEVVFPKDIQFAKNDFQIQIKSSKGGSDFFKSGFLGSVGVNIFVSKDEIEVKSLDEKLESVKIKREEIKDIYIQKNIIDRGKEGRFLYYVIVLILNNPISLPSLNDRKNIFNLLSYNFESLNTSRFILQEIKDMLKVKNDEDIENIDVDIINFDSLEETENSLVLKKPPFLGYCIYSLIGLLMVVVYFIQDPGMKSPSTPWILGVSGLITIGILLIAAFLNMGLYLSINKNQIQFANILPWGTMMTPKYVMIRSTSCAKASEISIGKRIDRGNDICWFEVKLFPDSGSQEFQIIASGISFEEAEYIAYAINRIIKDEPIDNRFNVKIYKKN